MRPDLPEPEREATQAEWEAVMAGVAERIAADFEQSTGDNDDR